MAFNEAQREAISHREGPILVLAGPGSGKTTVLTERVRSLIEESQVAPGSILVITFTRSAAREMQQRFERLVGGEKLPVTFGTFHSVFFRILKLAYGYQGKDIVREEQRVQFLKELIAREEIETEDEADFVASVLGEISAVKGEMMDLSCYYSKNCPEEVFKKLYRGYEERLRALGLIDFDDMLVMCYQLFSERKDILSAWQRKYTYILIDEFQDINRIQYEIVRMLALPENNLFVVGDDDQAIYGFRGADPEIMFRFGKDYPGAEQILLDVNYRSTSNIVTNSLKVIGNNEKRFDKKIQAVRDKGEFLHIQELKDPNEEAHYVADEIVKRMDRGVPAEDMAVLFRIHTDARPVAEELIRRKLPFQMREHLPNLYDHFIAKDIQAYFRLATGAVSRGDMLRVMNRPKRYIGRDSLAEGASFEEIRKFYCDKDWMLDRIDQFEWDVKMLSRMAPYAAVRYIRKRIGYDDFLKDHAFANRIERADLNEVLAEIAEAARPYATVKEWFCHIEEYTEALRRNERRKDLSGEGVRLMTLHAAKGLEFDTVFLIGANEGRMPYKKAVTEKEEEEERRLFYVGMTRAENVLRICYVKEKNGKEADPSRFVDELLEER